VGFTTTLHLDNDSPERKITLLQDLSVNTFVRKIFDSNEKSLFNKR
jgi:hypothetical protein